MDRWPPLSRLVLDGKPLEDYDPSQLASPAMKFEDLREGQRVEFERADGERCTATVVRLFAQVWSEERDLVDVDVDGHGLQQVSWSGLRPL